MPAREPKISEALLAFARPLLEPLPDDAGPEEMTPVLRLAALVWNAVAAEKLGHDNPYLDQARDILRTQTSGLQRDLALAMLADMEERKRGESPPDLRLIGDFQFVERAPGVLHLQVDCHAAKEPPRTLSKPRKRPSPAPEERSTESHPSWRALYDAAAELRRLAPWEWMGDIDVFGVEDPGTGTIGWCIVMGSGGEMFGLAIYRGDRGFDQIRRMHLHPFEVEDDAVFGQDAMVLSFLGRDEVEPEQLKRIRALGLRPRGRHAWPVFESHEPGRLPAPIAEDEVAFLRHAIFQALDVATRLREHPDLLVPREPDRLLVRASRDGGRTWVDTWIPEPSPPAPEASAPFDQVAARRALADLRRVEAVVECDVFPMTAVIQEEGQPPYFPAGFLAADGGTGVVLHVQLAHPSERHELARRELLATFQKHGIVPSTVLVSRPEIEALLAPLASCAGFELVLAKELSRVQEARAALEGHLSGPPNKKKRPGKPRKRR